MVQLQIRWRFKQIRQLTVGEGGGAHPSDLGTDLVGAPL
jgi:hypothetical protein